MKFKEKLALRAAEKLVRTMKKEDLLIPLREEIKKQGLTGDGQVDAAMERIEKSGMKKVFDQLDITRQDREEVFKE